MNKYLVTGIAVAGVIGVAVGIGFYFNGKAARRMGEIDKIKVS